ncbi:DNA-directed RNA polymerase III subunit RPC5 [Selaginella moellendorffii]|nr:DNA-directed RNA polymerase III subunit RPC5 [Selaginella moellendorffii]|eukprot:XP_002988629.2 DNA-directed RNA polymerase III subunit RPC5 [Selaginella moellendorffii]
MEPKFKPRVPARGRRSEASANASSVAQPPPQVKIEDLPPVMDEDTMEIDVKPEPLDFILDDDEMDIKVKMEDGAVVWEGMDGAGSSVPEEVTMESVADIVEDGDTVVREIEVHITPTADPDTKFYLLQYPLRPYWRPYELEQRCEAVRVKHQHQKLEVDLQVDRFGDNYDDAADDHLRIAKQTLTSTQGNLSTNYAIGILQGNKLHLNPLHAIVQLRPSLSYLNEADEQKKKNITRVESDDEMPDAEEGAATEKKPEPVAFKVEIKKQETERQQQSRLMSYAHLKQLEEAEAWITLEPHGLDSPVTKEIKMKMKSSANNLIRFDMSRNEYMKKLVPGRAPSAAASQAVPGLGKEPLSKSYLDTLPLDKRLHAVLSQGRVHVLQFERLMKLAPAGCTEEEVLDVLQKTAYLVQGCWVATSNMRYTGGRCAIRDYILLQFVKNRVVSRETLEQLRVSKEILREILVPLAVQNIKTGGWEFIESTDKTFIKRHNSIAKDQLQRWTAGEKLISDRALAVQQMGSGKAMGAKPGSGLAASTGIPPRPSTSSSMAPETLAALPDALTQIFLKHHVCTLQFICHCLRESAITKSQADNVKVEEKASAVAAAKGASAPVAELTAIVDTIATNINGVYFLTQLGDPTQDPFREVVIALLKQKSAGLQRSEIMEAFKLALRKMPSNQLYQKIMKELCYTRGATWVLKTGDGRPS